MLFAGWEVRIVKTCYRGLENARKIRTALRTNQISCRIRYRARLEKNNRIYFFPSGHGNKSCNLIGS